MSDARTLLAAAIHSELSSLGRSCDHDAEDGNECEVWAGRIWSTKDGALLLARIGEAEALRAAIKDARGGFLEILSLTADTDVRHIAIVQRDRITSALAAPDAGPQEETK